MTLPGVENRLFNDLQTTRFSSSPSPDGNKSRGASNDTKERERDTKNFHDSRWHREDCWSRWNVV